MNRLLRAIYINLKYKRKNVKIAFSDNISAHSCFEGNNRIGKRSTFVGEMGRNTYAGDNCVLYGAIGRYTSIANNVRFTKGKHPVNEFVSTSPIFFSTRGQCGKSFVKENVWEEVSYADKEKKVVTVVGNDVWIGEGAIILGGITIGDGAIVAAGAVVTKDVEPYSIVAGVPAKKIKTRFTEDSIEKLLKIKWWDRSEEWVLNHLTLFCNPDEFICLCEDEK